MSLRTILDRALNAHRRGDLAVAIRGYEEALRVEDQHPDALHLMGVAMLQQGRIQDAERSIRMAISRRPGDSAFHSNLGEALRAQGRLQDAERAYREAISFDPGHANAHNNLGLILSETGRAEQAVASLREADRLSPGSPETLTNLASALRAAGLAREAADTLYRVMEQIPEFHDARLVLCRVLIEDARLDEARRWADEGLAHAPDDAATLSAAALVSLWESKPEQAARRVAAALTAAKPSVAAMFACASVLLPLGQFSRAADLLRRIDTVAPGQPDVLALLAEACRKADDLAGALAACSEWVERQPDNPDAHVASAWVLRLREQFADAERSLERARELQPEHLGATIQAADLARQLDDPDRARHILSDGLAWAPDHPALLERLGGALLEAGEVASARRTLHRAIEVAPDHIPAYHRLAPSGRAGEEDRPIIERLVSVLEGQRLTPPDASAGHFAAAKMLDDLDEPERAFGHYVQANRLCRTTSVYEPRKHDARVDEIVGAYTRDRIGRLGTLGSTSRLPIIIAGMPRSGTTLVEQILASHPRVAGAGEIDVLARLSPGPSVPLAPALDSLDGATVKRLANIYLERLRRERHDAERITDKTPRNYEALGMAAILFPRAVVIHCQREPIDTCLSIYFQNLEVGNEFAYDPDDIAHHFAAYRRLMAHWANVLPAPVLAVRYEALVADLEGQCRRLLDFCGLDWAPECLEFHRLSRNVRTSSLWQVRQPLYSSSVQRWKRYGSALGPLRVALAKHGIETP